MSIAATRALLVAVGVSSLALACDEDRSQRPYTPFGVVTAAEPPKPPPNTVAPPSAFAPVKAMLAPLAAREWSFAGRTLKAPGKLTFEQALSATFDPAVPAAVVAWLTNDASKKKSATGAAPSELWLYPATGEPKKLFTLPGFLPTGPGCRATTKLTQTGPQTVTLDTRMTCDPKPLGRMPTGALSVIAPNRAEPHVLTLRIADSGMEASDGEVAFEIASLDRDDDGRDDIELSAKLGDGALRNQGTAVDAGVQFVWFDRAAGLSRDSVFPGKPLHDLGSIEVVRSTGKNTSLTTLARIAAIRRLLALLCAEARVPILLDQDNNPLSCNLGTTVFDFFAKAEIQAALAQKQWGNALTAFLRSDWYLGSTSEKAKADLRAALEQALPIKAARTLAVTDARASGPSSIPRFSPLSFGDQGLLIQHAEGVTRLDLYTLEELDANEEVDPWPLTVISPIGERFLGVAYPCDRPLVTLLSSSDSGAAAPPIATPLLSPRPGLCGGGRAPFAELPVAPVAWSKAGLSVLLAGSQIGPEARSIPHGSARSHNGKHAVIATAVGLLVLHPEGAEIWRSAEAPGKALSECVIDDSGERVACLDKSRARVLTTKPAAP